MKKYILILGLFVTSLAFSQGGYTKPVVTAINVTIADAGAIITATEVENALQENRIAINLNTDKITNATHTGEVTGATALTIASDVVDKDNLAVALKTKVALGDVSGTVDIDTSLGIHFTMNMTGNITSLTFSNLTNEELKTITLEITGDAGGYTITQPATVKPDNVWSSLDSTLKNQIQIYMFDISTPVFSTTLLKL